MLLVFSDDWGRHPSSCQHLMKHLLARQRVTWVNTIGMRPPSFDLSTVRRGWERIKQWSQPAVKSQSVETLANPVVLNPRMWPWFTRSHDRWINQRLLLRALRPVVEQAQEPVYAVTSIPIVADLMGELPVKRWTYYCVDDFATWPGLDQQAMQRMEQLVIQRCDECIAVSDSLRERLAKENRVAQYLPHGVDLDFWRRSLTTNVAERLSDLERPLAVFWGVIDQRMDVSWVRRLAQDMQRGSILLVGPCDNPDAALLKIPRVVQLAPLPFEQLPELGQLADVLVMPYADLPVTRAMQPLKLKEYLATGKPVVVSALPSTIPWADCLDVAMTADQFSALVRERFQTGNLPAQAIARQRLEHEGWAAKAMQFEAWIIGEQGASHIHSSREGVSVQTA